MIAGEHRITDKADRLGEDEMALSFLGCYQFSKISQRKGKKVLTKSRGLDRQVKNIGKTCAWEREVRFLVCPTFQKTIPNNQV